MKVYKPNPRQYTANIAQVFLLFPLKLVSNYSCSLVQAARRA